MRIAIIAPPWIPIPPVAYGGTELVIDVMARGLRAVGHEVLLSATGDSTCEVERRWLYPEALGTELFSPAAERAHVTAAYAAAIEWGAEVIHDHTLQGPVHALGLRRCPPAVTTNHGPFTGPLAKLYRRVCGQVAVIAISRHQASTARGTEIHRVIHHGIETAHIPLGEGGGGFALFLGRMCPEKGVHRAIRAARAAGVPLRIAAKMREPAERQYFDQMVRPHLGGDVEYVGEVGPADKVALLVDATCLVNPIRWPEPFGLVMVEAMACGTPVVTTHQGAAPEIVDQGVTGFIADGPTELAAAMVNAGTIERSRCRLAVEQRFSAERMCREHAAVYREWIGADPTERRFDVDSSVGMAG